jgi:maltooligosyltrehalose trehalohydrolase
MLRLRAAEIVPRLKGMEGHAGEWRQLAARALSVTWRLGDGSRLALFANFAETAVALGALPDGRILYVSHKEPGAALPPLSVLYALSPAG